MSDHTLHTYPTPVGEMIAVFSPRGLRMLEFIGQPRVDREMAQVEAAAGGPAVAGQNSLTEQLGRELAEYFAGARRVFDVPLDLLGTPFQMRVWKALLEIPYGETWSYGQEARHIGSPTASRAVAAANGQNKVSIVVPCHRVIGSNGTLTGYGGGLPRKQFLLALEEGAAQPQGKLWSIPE
ncbi:methylated-DNA--[protein]-cysteine S-methyltransferase [Ottowia thiooxydans]|uniref:methylated-DNA--[protein]-cysteine S-methyltransferase n=1 Tax=Ottowia thiooxydans TaxID=219182 RepID=UPI00040FD88A|nr:methylated-DNA--[protein]-cysteine S-methyltransferase [Ottowia thiooxydans]